MKKFSVFLRVLITLVLLAVSFVFIIIEGSLLLYGDWSLFENRGIALIQVCLKLLIAIAVFAFCLFSLIKRRRISIFWNICLLVSSAAMSPWLSNNFGLYFIGLAVLFFIFNIMEEWYSYA